MLVGMKGAQMAGRTVAHWAAVTAALMADD
jgi:hypothetical protein